MHSTTSPHPEKRIPQIPVHLCPEPCPGTSIRYITFFSLLFLCVPRKGTGSESNNQGYHSFVFRYLLAMSLEIYKMSEMP